MTLANLMGARTPICWGRVDLSRHRGGPEMWRERDGANHVPNPGLFGTLQSHMEVVDLWPVRPQILTSLSEGLALPRICGQ
jgi:hypothetical protein